MSALTEMKNSLRQGPPWDSICDFATSKSFCNKRLYPRQLTLLKLIYLETEQMTDYDLEVIDGWREGFKGHKDIMGVPPDVWDRVTWLQENGYDHFTQVQAVGGRRGSKGIIGGILGAERLAFMYSLGDWQAHFGLDPGSVGELTVVSTSQATSARRQFADIRRTVEGCRYLRSHMISNRYTEFSIRTPADEARINALRLAGVPVDREIASLYINASASSSATMRGGAVFMSAYDEFAHFFMGSGSVKSGEEIYNGLQPSLDQFGKDQLTYIPSSPYTKIGQFYELYQQGCVTMDAYNDRVNDSRLTLMSQFQNDDELDIAMAEPEWLVFQLPSWSLYLDWERSHEIPVKKGSTQMGPRFRNPVQWPPDGERPENTRMRRLEHRNPEKFRVERRSQFASVIDAYLDEARVDAMFETPLWRKPLTDQDQGLLMYTYRMHGDPSTTNANFGFCIAHLEDSPCDGCGWTPVPEDPTHTVCQMGGHIWPHVIIDKLQVWKPENFPGHTIDYVAVGEQIEGYCQRFISTRTVSFDQWNSAGFLSNLKRKFGGRMRVIEQTFTEKENTKRCELFKSILNLGWLHSYRDNFFDEGQGSLLEMELKFLQLKLGKVVKQEFGPCTTKDLADSVMVVSVDLLHQALDRWHTTNRIAVGSTAVAPLRSGREADRQRLFGMTTHDPSGRGMGANRARLMDQQREKMRNNRIPDFNIRTRGRRP